jgi:hypothetical protein
MAAHNRADTGAATALHAGLSHQHVQDSAVKPECAAPGAQWSMN